MPRRNNKKSRPQNVRNREYMEAMQELRRSNASGKNRSVKDYRRKPKHGNWD